MANMFKIRRVFLLTLSLAILFCTVAIVSAQEGLLDDEVLVGQFGEKHRKNVEEDELRFINGEFHSIVYEQKGFNEGVYTATTAEGRIYFEAETVNPKQGKIRWRGIVHGDSIVVNFLWSKKGWLSDTERDYLFNGTLKK
jgi:succinate dehydrogenase flavin-adding protein (antitoxin of CptAB toxin-antitoxin module)